SVLFFCSSRRRHTRSDRDWSSDVCSSDLSGLFNTNAQSPEDLNWIRSLTPESFRKNMAALVRRYDERSPDGPAHFPVVFEKTKRLWLNEPNIAKEELAKILAPTMVMAGDRDSIPIEHTLELFRSIEGAHL